MEISENERNYFVKRLITSEGSIFITRVFLRTYLQMLIKLGSLARDFHAGAKSLFSPNNCIATLGSRLIRCNAYLIYSSLRENRNVTMADRSRTDPRCLLRLGIDLSRYGKRLSCTSTGETEEKTIEHGDILPFLSNYVKRQRGTRTGAGAK